MHISKVCWLSGWVGVRRGDPFGMGKRASKVKASTVLFLELIKARERMKGEKEGETDRSEPRQGRNEVRFEATRRRCQRCLRGCS